MTSEENIRVKASDDNIRVKALEIAVASGAKITVAGAGDRPERAAKGFLAVTKNIERYIVTGEVPE